MTIEEKIALFFMPPTEPDGGMRSALYRARRDIQDAFIRKVVAEDLVPAEAAKERHALFLTVIGINTTVDLLAKFHAGSDDPRKAGERMREFAKRYMFPLSSDPDKFADVFYHGCRNPTTHSFTMYSKKYKMGLISGNGMWSGPIWSIQRSENGFVVCVEGLFATLAEAIKRYREELLTSPALQAKFEAMFEFYGGMPVQVLVMGPYAGAQA